MKQSSRHSFSSGVSIQDEILERAARDLCERIDKELIWSVMKEAHQDWHLVAVPWRLEPQERMWTEACAWALETFGLPGESYVTHPGSDALEFLFKHKADAILFSLKWM